MELLEHHQLVKTYVPSKDLQDKALIDAKALNPLYENVEKFCIMLLSKQNVPGNIVDLYLSTKKICQIQLIEHSQFDVQILINHQNCSKYD